MCNYDKSAASFYRQESAWVPYMFWNFYSVKNHKIAYNSTTAEAREELTQFCNPRISEACLTKFKNSKILLNKISHSFLLTTKQFTSQNIPITS